MYDNKGNINFILNLSIIDFPKDRIYNCISALKYISEKTGLKVLESENKDLVELTIKQEFSSKHPLTDELIVFDSLLLHVEFNKINNLVFLTKNIL